MIIYLSAEDITNAFILLLAGAADMKNAKEIWWQTPLVSDGKLTIEFPTKNPNYVILREYFNSGAQRSEGRYINNLIEGKYITWFENGKKNYEGHYQHGQVHGLVKVWRADGQLSGRTKYKNGRRQR